MLMKLQSKQNGRLSLSLAVGRVWRIASFQQSDSHGDFYVFLFNMFHNFIKKKKYVYFKLEI